MPQNNHPTISLSSLVSYGRLPFSRPHPAYDYDPCAMLDNRKVKVWWLGRQGTDNVLYTESNGGSSWTTPISVLQPRHGTGHFDRAHVGNCSVIKVKGKYHMYYSAGRDDDPQDPNRVTNAVGYAESADGIHWSRPNQPIFLAQNDRVQDWRTQNIYGAGTPSAAYVEGLFYLLYQDTTGNASNWNAGIYVVRASDAEFKKGVEVLTSRGWERRTASNMTEFAIQQHNAPDVMWCPELRQFMWLYHSTGEIAFADESFTRLPHGISLGIPNAIEGTGFVRDPHGHVVTTELFDCL